MKRALVFLVLAACGRPSVPGPSLEWSEQALGCGDFFVAFVSKDKTKAVTVNVDRKALALSTGTQDVDVTRVTAKLDDYPQPMVGEVYCTDYGTGQPPPSTRAVGIGRLQVTIDRQPAQAGDAYPVSLRLDDVDLGAGVVVPELNTTHVNVGWFPG